MTVVEAVFAICLRAVYDAPFSNKVARFEYLTSSARPPSQMFL